MAAQQYLIIGQGLAGTILSHELDNRDIAYKVVDNGHKTAATKAAAGIINPVTGRRYVKSWMIDDLLPVSKSIYAELERKLDSTLVKSVSILRALSTNHEENSWHEATSRPGYAPYILDSDLGLYNDIVYKRQAYGEIAQGMQVQVSHMIKLYGQYLKSSDKLIIEDFDSIAYNYDAETYSYKGDNYEALIFCDGYRSIYHPLFKDLPFQPAKGEAFTVRIEKDLPAKLLRDKIFIAPQNNHEFWTGGGYTKGDYTVTPTEDFRKEWTADLEDLVKVPYTITDHRAGVRPSVRGRKPLIGQHHKYPRVYLFNGLGTKGTSLAPYWAKRFVELLIDRKPISAEVDLNRFVTN